RRQLHPRQPRSPPEIPIQIARILHPRNLKLRDHRIRLTQSLRLQPRQRRIAILERRPNLMASLRSTRGQLGHNTLHTGLQQIDTRTRRARIHNLKSNRLRARLDRRLRRGHCHRRSTTRQRIRRHKRRFAFTRKLKHPSRYRRKHRRHSDLTFHIRSRRTHSPQPLHRQSTIHQPNHIRMPRQRSHHLHRNLKPTRARIAPQHHRQRRPVRYRPEEQLHLRQRSLGSVRSATHQPLPLHRSRHHHRIKLRLRSLLCNPHRARNALRARTRDQHLLLRSGLTRHP